MVDSVVTVRCTSLLFLMLSLVPRIDAFMLSLMLVSHLPPSFLDTYSLSMSSFGCASSSTFLSSGSFV